MMGMPHTVLAVAITLCILLALGSASISPQQNSELYEAVEPCEPYNPEMSESEKANAEILDGWLVMPVQNLEFTHLEPSDDCRDVGWEKRDRPRRVWDAFQFFNELDILDLRLHELNDTLNKQRFAPFANKIIHVVVDDLPYDKDPWKLENFQRNALVRGLRGAHPNDLVIIADVDEIPAGYVVDLIRRCQGPTSPTWLYSRFFNFKFEWEFAGQWKHPQIVRVAQLDIGDGNGGVKPQSVRMGIMRDNHTMIESAGWHCSFFTDALGVVDKIKAFTHQELNKEEWLRIDSIEEAMRLGVDYFNSDQYGRRKEQPRHGGMHHNPSCYGLPQHVLANPSRFVSWLPDCQSAHGDDVDLSRLALPTCSSMS